MRKKIYIGWDIGGANTKICIFNDLLEVKSILVKNIKIWNDFNDLKIFCIYISKLYKDYDIESFITITAESCDNFKNRDFGIKSLISCCELNITGKKYYYNNLDEYLSYDDAINSPKTLYSTNWMLTYNYLNSTNEYDLIIDIGSTTTDFIYKNINKKNNINDYLRLKNKTLLYMGCIRTPLAMFANNVYYKNSRISLINEIFATSGDIFNITKDIDFKKLNYIGVDNEAYTIENSYIRLSRMIGLDYIKSDKKNMEDIAYQIKEIFLNNILENINYLFPNKNNITISSVGEGKKLVREICYDHSISYKSIYSNEIKICKNCNKELVYSNFTCVLPVLLFFKKF